MFWFEYELKWKHIESMNTNNRSRFRNLLWLSKTKTNGSTRVYQWLNPTVKNLVNTMIQRIRVHAVISNSGMWQRRQDIT